ncbi:glycosyltransferase family 1 protein [Companilactobacillus suantsaicola]|uniref:Glycosyltransferase family 1 protein n=1 Tax=Companilactobacillus suantsaicola TaxID=2487723 RepID=A0A4Z0JKV5_9LACO|nr:glycosyltransferase [Companilactobacillus suantsaicola]TGD22749.1 glycosyltransferase family 1 protein [Companilactobacillus suantsaicola]
MIRVMQINLGESYGGVSSMLFNLYAEMDHSKVTFDFVAPKCTSFRSKEKEIEKMNGRIIELKTEGNLFKRKIEFFFRLSRLIKSMRYKIVHINSGSTLFNVQVALIAKICGVKRIIVHSHNAGNDSGLKRFLMKVSKPLLEMSATDFFACSNKAARYMFLNRRYREKNFVLIKNAVDINKFKFSNTDRNIYRKRYGLNGKKVILHVGRFSNQKNHSFLVDIFDYLNKMNDDTRLVLVGVGELQEDIIKKVNLLGLSSKVLFMNLRSDINHLMSMSDVLVLPSFYEGLPVVGIEAQASGLNCVFADTITDEVNLTEYNKFISLSASLDVWSKSITELSEIKMDLVNRLEKSKIVEENGYSISSVSKKLEKFYLNT